MISIIIPVYNVEQYLKRCLDSVLNQSGNYNFEIIIVNDGSPDNSQCIIDEYVATYPLRIKGYQKENGGLSSARNYGIKKASGEYILLIDSDDYIEVDLLEKVMVKIANDKSKMAIFDYYLTKQNNKKKPKKIYQNNQEYIIGKQAAWSRIYHKSLFENHQFPEGINYEDLALVPFLMAKAEGQITYVETALYDYIVDNAGSIMNTYNRKIFDIYQSLEHLFNLFEAEGLFEKYRDELQYLALEHLCIGHSYRLIRYPERKYQDFKDIVIFMERHFGDNWQQNKFIKQKIHKQNIESPIAKIVPLYLKIYKIIFS